MRALQHPERSAAGRLAINTSGDKIDLLPCGNVTYPAQMWVSESGNETSKSRTGIIQVAPK
jgi:hypothetical protein